MKHFSTRIFHADGTFRRRFAHSIGLTAFAAAVAPGALANDAWSRSRTFENPAAAAEDRFGASAGLHGTLAILGSPGDDERGAEAGAAYLFSTETGNLLFKLMSSDGRAGDAFGHTVGIGASYIVVGAPLDDDRGLDSGVAFVFNPITGDQVRKITAPDGGFMDRFAWSAAVDGPTGIFGSIGDDVGATDSGSASVFDLASGTRLSKFTTADAREGDQLGHAVAISGGTGVAGAPLHDAVYVDDGAAYVFSTSTGTLRVKLTADLSRDDAQFGFAVGIDAGLVVVGAPGGGESGEGAAWALDANTGTVVWRLLPVGALPGDAFGASVAVTDELALVGAPRAAGLVANAGTARLFDLRTGRQLAEIRDPDGQSDDHFGTSVGLQAGSILAGSPGADRSGLLNVGAASLFVERDAFAITPVPLRGGDPGTFTLYNLKPQERTWMLYSMQGLGDGTFIRQLGVVVDLENPEIAWGPQLTDATGSIEVTGTIPFVQQPVDIWFQGVQDRAITDVIQTQIVR